MSEVPTNMPLPPNAIAFVINGEVVDVIRCPDRMAAYLLSRPVIVDVTDNVENVQVGYSYDEATGTFAFKAVGA